MDYYVGETVTMLDGMQGTIEYMDEEMDYYEIYGEDGNFYTCSSMDFY